MRLWLGSLLQNNKGRSKATFNNQFGEKRISLYRL